MVDILGVIDIPFWAISVVVCYFIYYKLTADYDRWKQRGVPGPKPLPFFGTMLPMLKHGLKGYDDIMRKHGKVAGGFDGQRPVLYIHDTDMLKEVMVKQFDCFVNRRPFDVIINSFKDMVTLINDDRWRKVRNHITPTFTSGKLKGMYPAIRNTAKRLKAKLIEDVANDGKFNAKDKFGAYTMDVIALTAFGIDSDALNHPKNDFVRHAYNFFNIFSNGVVSLIFFLLPKLMRLTEKIGLLPWLVSMNLSKAEEFFRDITVSVMKDREENPDKTRTDFISLCMDANKEEVVPEKRLTVDEILAQAILFFVAGYDTTQATITYLAYNLALNPDCQDRLLEEIDELFPDQDAEIDYEKLQKMTYFDQCLEESMRMFPPLLRVDRQCNKDTTVKGLQVRKGETVVIPIYAIQHDEDVYENPDHFDPERFNAENKALRSQFSWIPFGMGPRNCIGMRLALIEIRLAIVTILRTHKFVKVSETVPQEDLTWKAGFVLTPNEPLQFAIEPRN